MTHFFRARARWFLVVAFAVAMAWVEAACVYYLRVMVRRIDPYQANPLPLHGALGQVELVREAATMVMLAALGGLAGRTRSARLGYTAIAFGVWDIFYYVFLYVIVGWPRSVFDWDILFLLPLPWWGPVIAPVSIAALMIVGGTMASERRVRRPATSLTYFLWGLNAIGMSLALYAFMADALGAVRDGLDVTTVLPRAFNWPVFAAALLLMAAPVLHSSLGATPGPTRVARRAGT